MLCFSVDCLLARLRWNSGASQPGQQLLYIHSIPPDNGLQICPKHVEVDWQNKLRINSGSSWFLLHRYIEMHGQQNIKFRIPLFTDTTFVLLLFIKVAILCSVDLLCLLNCIIELYRWLVGCRYFQGSHVGQHRLKSCMNKDIHTRVTMVT